MNIYLILVITLVLSLPCMGNNTESQLLSECSNKNLKSCELLATFYVKNGNLDKSLLLGEALCKKEVGIGCTIQGISLISKKQIKEGTQSFNYACDKFEPYACRSLGRLMKEAGSNELSHVYFRKACHFGLKEICSDLKKDYQFISKAGIQFMNSVREDCTDTSHSLCKSRIQSIQTCHPPLTKKDCEIIPSLLNIFFRSKLIQSEAKLLLNKIWISQIKYKKNHNKFSFKISELIKPHFNHQNYHYVFGFQKSCSTESKYSSLDIFPDYYKNISPTSILSIRKAYTSKGKQECYDSKWGFEAFAISALNPLSPEMLDIWKINQDGNLIHMNDGSVVQ